MITFSPPQLVSFPSSPLGPQMVLVVRTSSQDHTGFATAFWKDDNVLAGNGNAWSDWQFWELGQQPPQDWNPPADWTGFHLEAGPIPPAPAWPLVGYIDPDQVFRANGFFAIEAPAGTAVVGQPWWQIPIADVAFDVFRNDFLPRVGAAWKEGPRNRLNIFGSAALGAAPLRELWWDGAQWNWTDHDRGPNGDALGPSSLVFPKTSNAYLFGVTAGKDNVQLLAYRPGAGWDFAGGFQGPDGTADLRAPVALFYGDDRGTNVHAFTVGRLGNGEYHLFQTHQLFGSDWEAWVDFGTPPGEPISVCQELPPDLGVDIRTQFLAGDPFTMTSACVWQDDQGLHIHLFGYSDIVPQFDPRVGRGSLVHFSWKGGDWRNGHWSWETTTRPVECLNFNTSSGPARLPTTFQTTSSAVYQGQTRDGQARQRVSAVGFTSPGQQGTVWEFVMDTTVDQDFHWLQFA
jgi:hypothetical protein